MKNFRRSATRFVIGVVTNATKAAVRQIDSEFSANRDDRQPRRLLRCFRCHNRTYDANIKTCQTCGYQPGNRSSGEDGRRIFSVETKKELWEKQRKICGGCLDEFTQWMNMEIDHVVPLSRGGTNEFSNLQVLCKACNRLKGTGTMDDLIIRLKKKGLR